MYTEIEFLYGNSLLKARIPVKNLTCILNTQNVKGLENERNARREV